MALLERPAEAPEQSPEDSARQEEQYEKLQTLGVALIEKRTKAIQHRAQTGIELQWTQDQEFYEGIDDANRQEHGKNSETKPPYLGTVKETATGSTIFPNITAPYCEAASARIADMLLPTDDETFKIKPTPIPDMVSLSEGKYQPKMLREAAGLYPGEPQRAEQKLADSTKQALLAIEEANTKAGKAQSRIEDWLVECNWHGEVRKVIEDSARIGSGVVKGPHPIKRKTVSIQPQGIAVAEKIQPGSKRMSAWDLFPDPACGENIHNGSFIWERDRLTEKQLQDLKGGDYLDPQIDKVLEEGPKDAVATANAKPDGSALIAGEKGRFEVWVFHGTLGRDELEACGCDLKPLGEREIIRVPAIVTMVNDCVIKAALNPVDTGDFPYDVMPWRKKAGMPWGDGVARQIRTPQRIVTAALRAMMVNAGRAAGPMIVWQQGKVVPADGKYEVGPWKLLYVGEDSDGSEFDVRKAVGVIQIPILQAELERIIQIGLKLAEDVTGLPMILQGQQGKAPDTVGGMQLLNDNASSVLRRLARTFDDHVTEPHVRRYYVWVLQYGEQDEKGDFQIDARGSSALVERSIQNQEMSNIVQASTNPVFGLDPKKSMSEYLKSRKLDPKRFEFDDEEWKKVVENMQKGPSDPRLAVAQLRAQLEERLKTMDQQFETQERGKDRQLELIGKAFDQKLEAMRASGDRSISFDKIKAALAETVMELRQQREFYVADAAMQMHTQRNESQQRGADRALTVHQHHTPSGKDKLTAQTAKETKMEPVGQAPKGKAFQH